MATAAGGDGAADMATDVPLTLRRFFGGGPNPYLEREMRRSAKSPPPRPSCPPGGIDTTVLEPARTSSSSTLLPTVVAKPSLPPPWLRKDDREVLRYYCYLQEAVHEGGDPDLAAARVRRFTVCFFTACEAFTVEEPREPNSGIPQGTFLKKQRVPKPAWACSSSSSQQQYWGPRDVVIGCALNLYGRWVKALFWGGGMRIMDSGKGGGHGLRCLVQHRNRSYTHTGTSW